MTERAGQLRQFKWPSLNVAMLASFIRWLMAALILAALAWLASRTLRRREEQGDKSKAALVEEQ
jgi:hypothetical protein